MALLIMSKVMHTKAVLRNLKQRKYYTLFILRNIWKRVHQKTTRKNFLLTKFLLMMLDLLTNILKISQCSTILLGFEVANHVLSHFTAFPTKESSDDLEADILFTKKELNIISYLSGYAFGIFTGIYENQIPHTMLVGKSEVPSSNNNMLTQAIDGDLWRFIEVSKYFIM